VPLTQGENDVKFEIKSRFSGAVLFSLECGSLRLCVEAAVKSRANLSGADLSGADLYGADLSRANLSGADLSGADLSRANLSRANLSRANLYGANLYGADLSGADLSRANLYGANLYGADLYGANLYGADLSGADLSRANLSGTKDAAIVLARQRITPDTGSFFGWKKLHNGIIAKLYIPSQAERMNALGSRKCRASIAIVAALFDGDKTYTGIGLDKHTGYTKYEVGREVLPDSFDPNIREECSHGIHFFITREEAEAY
jgi:hypothetical protein